MYEPERFRTRAYTEIIAADESVRRCRATGAALAAMRTAGCRSYPLEACGLLIGRLDESGWEIHEARPVANLNRERADDRFELDPDGYRNVDRSLRDSPFEIVGVFHSHPDCPARPSPTDLAGAWEGFLYPIVSICDGEARELRFWTLSDGGGTFEVVPVEEIE